MFVCYFLWDILGHLFQGKQTVGLGKRRLEFTVQDGFRRQMTVDGQQQGEKDMHKDTNSPQAFHQICSYKSSGNDVIIYNMENI